MCVYDDEKWSRGKIRVAQHKMLSNKTIGIEMGWKKFFDLFLAWFIEDSAPMTKPFELRHVYGSGRALGLKRMIHLLSEYTDSIITRDTEDRMYHAFLSNL